MSVIAEKILHQFMSTKSMQEIDHWVAKYPQDQKQSAVMSTLRIVQETHNYLTPELMDAVADYLDMPAVAVYEVASFYSMYERKPVGRHVVNVCTNISCKLKNVDGIVDSLQNALDIGLGETTLDGRFTLKAVECLGACVHAPVMQVDKNYHENLTKESVVAVLEQYK